jgi:outer membrane protein insertion porin family
MPCGVPVASVSSPDTMPSVSQSMIEAFRRAPGPRRGRGLRWVLITLMLAMATLGMPLIASGQTIRGDERDMIDRPISDIRLLGLVRVDRQLVLNNLRTAIGDPYEPATVRDDIRRLEQLGLFAHVRAEVILQPDGSVHVVFTLGEQQIIQEIQVTGNTLVSDQDLRAVIPLRRGGPRDEYLIEQAVRNIEEVYRKRGHYLASVTYDQQELDQSGILLFRVIEGPRVRVRAIEFSGNHAFEDRLLRPQIGTRTAIAIVRRGELDEEQLIEDVAALDRFYRERGYLDVRVDRMIELSPDNREVKVTFIIDEGRLYTLRSVLTETRLGRPLRVFAPEQVAALLEIQPGDVYRQDLLRQSREAILDAYGRLGYFGTFVEFRPSRAGVQPEVDLVIEIQEGERTFVGMVDIQGNFLTRDRVIRRNVRLHPGRPLDATEIDRTTRRIRDTRLFNDVRITVQDPHPDEPHVRDVLVEIKERDTGSVNFGLTAGTDSGFGGEFSIVQENFDLFDTPDSIGEVFRGRAFRGGGQRFAMIFRPGTELFQYSVSLTEPRLFDSEYSLSVSGEFLDRFFRRYDETRTGGTFQLGRRLGDIWQVGINGRVERIQLSNIQPSAPTVIFDEAGPDLITGLGISLTRSTIATITRPGRGSRFEISYDRIGALGGDFNFNRLSAQHTIHITIFEDFLGRPSTLRLNSQVGYIFGGHAPTYERFYRGGRSFRGFRFREVGPKGIRADTLEPSRDAIGGRWDLFAGAQYEFPIFGNAMTGVLFVDSGTVTDRVGFDDYRVSVGTGIRLYIPAFGPVPIAFDFAFPLRKLPTDQTQVFSFSVELPF